MFAAAATLLIPLATAVPAQAATITARSLLWKVSVAAESNSSYDRARFGDWVDANGDCQNTRAEVLIAESRVSVTYTSSSHCTRPLRQVDLPLGRPHLDQPL